GGAVAFEPKTLKMRSGCDGGGKGALVQNNLSAALSTSNDQTVFVQVPDGGTLLAVENHPADSRLKLSKDGLVQTLSGRMGTGGGNVPMVYGIGNGQTRQPAAGEQSSALNCMHDPQAVIIDCRNHRADAVSGTLQAKSAGGQSLNYINPVAVDCRHDRVEEISGTLQAKNTGGHSLYTANPIFSDYIVRRLTPRECAKLQGFPPDWCAGLETPEPTEEDIAFWARVFETHRRALGKSERPKTHGQIVKWLRAPHTDSAEYKLWGNGVALPCVVFVMQGITELAQSAGRPQEDWRNA
ncbi:MAG: DNA cytosine methyltransferase, partial [Firmicutes bacterium]|nr:DNA cytosine methyltransferase [Bacillota bacterium]